MAANCFINYMIDFSGLKDKSEIEECEVCDNIAAFHCVECNNFLCNGCKITHEKRPTSESHLFCSISEFNNLNWKHRNSKEVSCTRHKNCPITSYCKTCEDPTCAKCCEVHSAPQHIVISLDDAFQQYKYEAGQLVERVIAMEELTKEKINIIEESKQVWVSSTVKCEQQINHYVDRLQQLLENTKDKLLEELNDLSLKKEKQLDDEIESLKMTKANLMNVRMRNQGLMGTVNPTGALHMINEGYQQLQHAVRNVPRLHVVNVGRLTFEPQQSSLEGFTLGSVYEEGMLDPAKCSTEPANERIEITMGDVVELTLTTNDSNGRRRHAIADSISVVLRCETGDIIGGDVIELDKSSFKISCVCKWEGECSLDVHIFDTPVLGSPFTVVGLREQLLLKTIETGQYWTKKKSNIDDVCFTTDGILLACSSTNQILRFDLNGDYIDTISLEERKEIQGIYCIDFDLIAMTEKTKSEVLICKQDGAVVRQFGKGVLQNPKGIVVSVRRNEVFVTDCQAHCIFRFSTEGRLLSKIGSFGNGDGQLNTPHSVAVINSDDDLIVSDSLNHRLQIFKHDGTFLRIIGQGRGHGNGKVEYPRAVGIDRHGHVIVGSSNSIQLFNQRTGQFLRRLDHRNDEVMFPYGIVVDRGRIAVANWRGLGSKSANIKILKDKLACDENNTDDI